MRKSFTKVLGFAKRRWKIIGVLVIGALITFGAISSCGKEVQYVYQLEEVKTAPVEQVVSVVGSVSSEKEVDLSFERGGTVANILVTEGQQVFSGALLAELEDDNIQNEIETKRAMLALEEIQLQKLRNGLRPEEEAVLNTNIANAERSLASLDKSIAATKEKHLKQLSESRASVENARIQFEVTKSSQEKIDDADSNTAQLQLDNAKKSLSNTLALNESNIKSSEARLTESKIALENAKKSLETGRPLQDKNIATAQVEAFYNATTYLDEVDRSLRAVNSIITVEDYNKDQNAAYKNLLGVLELNSYGDLVSSYNRLKNSYADKKSLFVITGDVLEFDEIISRLDTLKTLVSDSSQMLSKANNVLNKSLTSTSFTVSDLNSLKSTILTQKDKTAGTLSNISTTKFNVENLELTRDNQVSGLQNAVASAEAALISAEQALVNAKTTAISSESNARNAVLTAEEALRRSEGQTEGREGDIDKLRQGYEQAQKQYETLEATLKEAEASLDRSRTDLSSQLATARVQKTSQSADARDEDIRSQEERVKQARLALETSENNLRDAQIRAPRPGIISMLNYEPGEAINAGQPALVLIGDGVNTITTLIAETEIAVVKEGQPVRMDFDAFTEEELYMGEVSFVNPNKTVQDGVIYYEVKIAFDEFEYPTREVRPGFSANLEIITESMDALSVSNIATSEEDGKVTVEVVTGGEGTEIIYEEREIITGMEGEENVEVLSGLVEGDQVILSKEEITE